jgi:hypothetical protein
LTERPMGPAGRAEGTRTEAVQKVPQANPEETVSPTGRAPDASDTCAEGPP